jgi:hypothetical protein
VARAKEPPGGRLKRTLVTFAVSIVGFTAASYISATPSGSATVTSIVPRGETTIAPASGSTRTTVPSATRGSCQNSSYRGQSATPAFVHRMLRAVSLEATPLSAPDYQAVGDLIPTADVVTKATTGSKLRFGLAVYPNLMEATYPALSSDGGTTWRIDGPLFWIAAADGASVTANVGALGSEGAYFWGQTGNFVKVTTDEGSQWWLTGFAAGVYKVSASHGVLRTVALGNQVSCTDFQAFLYVSTDSGRTWTFHGRVPNVSF